MRVETTEATRRLELHVSRELGRIRLLDGRRSTAMEFFTTFPVLAWPGANEDLILGASQARRELLDRAVVSRRPALASDYRRYRSALEAKRSLLEQRSSEGLWTWNELLIRHGLAIQKAREECFAELLVELRAVANRLLPSRLPLSATLSSGMGEESHTPGTWEKRFVEVANEELAAQRCLLGPHRARFELALGGKPPRDVASGSERKLLGLALVLAAATVANQCRQQSILLVDDFDAELDRHAAMRVLDELSRFPSVLATSSQPPRESIASDLFEAVSVAGLEANRASFSSAS